MQTGRSKRAVTVAVLSVLCGCGAGCGLRASGRRRYVKCLFHSADRIDPAGRAEPDAADAQAEEKPLILQVGSHVLFAEAHIKGAEYAGPGSQDAGLQQLHDRVAQMPRKTLIVIYCGCCPWTRCPNLGPAYKQLRDMGFTNVKVLYLADNWRRLGQ